jgi:hypothetical protein
MKRRRLHSAAVALRVLCAAVLLSIPLAGAILWTTCTLRPQGVLLFGTHFVGATSLDCQVLPQERSLVFMYRSGWDGTLPAQGGLFDVPGLSISRTVVTLTGQTRGDAILDIRIRWWLLLVANLPLLLAAFIVAQPLLRRMRHPPGRCAKCGYDLRATPERCPECGTVTVKNATA